ncbi:MAG: hypothetical protein OXC07_04460 [Kistimonas sp.]|nr:hypothetical protein [Kistimonas sp.]
MSCAPGPWSPIRQRQHPIPTVGACPAVWFLEPGKPGSLSGGHTGNERLIAYRGSPSARIMERAAQAENTLAVRLDSPLVVHQEAARCVRMLIAPTSGAIPAKDQLRAT